MIFLMIVLAYLSLGLLSIFLTQEYFKANPHVALDVMKMGNSDKKINEPAAVLGWICLWPLVMYVLYKILTDENFCEQMKKLHDKKNRDNNAK